MINENFALSEEQIKLYLDKINMDYPLDPTIETLKELQCKHLATVPYENLNILYHIPISLNGDDLFQKIVIDGRGGFCFELNGLYQWLLKALGYQVTSLPTRLLAVNTSDQMLRHRLMRVDFEDCSYITDVGIRSESPRYALKLEENLVQTDDISKYRFIKDTSDQWIFEQKKPEKDWSPIFELAAPSRYERDYIMPTFFCATHPSSPFTKGPQMSIFPPGKHITIANRTFILSEGSTILEQKELTDDEFKKACLDYFHIDVNTLKH